MLQALNLSMNKSTTNLSRVEVRDSDKGEILESFNLNSDGTPYDLSGKSLVFNENKDGDKFVSDPNVTIVDARIGHITYQLHDQVHSAPGTAWFDIIQDGAKIDSTTDFYVEVRDGLKCTVYNTTYISDLEKLKQQMEALIGQADGELKTELQRAEQQLNQELQNFRNQYNSLSNDFQNQFKSAQNARQADYNKQKDAINADWNDSKGIIWGQWINDKASIDKQAQDTVQAIKDNAKQVLDKDQADWNAKQNQWDSTFSAIVKEWQVKTNSLNSTVQDLTTKFGNIINELTDLMNNKLPDMNAKTDAVNKKIDQLKASLSDVDWTEYAHRSDNSGGVNLLPNTSTFKLFSTGHYGDSDAHNGISIEPKNQHSSETNINLVKTKIARVWADKAMNASLNIPGGTYLPAGTYTLSFLARTNGNDSSPAYHFSLYSNWTGTHGGDPLGQSDAVNNVWSRHQITFTIPESYYHMTLRIQQYDDADFPGGSLYFANLKLEAGSIATDWCQSYLDFDRLDGRHDPIDAPDFNNLTSTGIYMITQPDHGQNYPAATGGILKVDNANDNQIKQEYYEDVANGSIYHRQAVSGTWRAWQKLANIDDLSKVKIKLQSLDQNGDTFTNTQTATKQSDGFYQLDLFDNDWTANRVSWLLKNTQSYYVAANTNLNDIKAPGLYYCSGSANVVNIPHNESNWFSMVVNGESRHGSQTFYPSNSNQLYVRTWNSNGFKEWRRLVNDGDYSSLQNLINGLKINVIKSYDTANGQAPNPTEMNINEPCLVDQLALHDVSEFIREIRNHTDFRYPTVSTWNTTVDLNSDTYMKTGIYQIGNCVVENGPWVNNEKHWNYIQVVAFDNNTIYQTISTGDTLFGRFVSPTRKFYPQWQRFATMDDVTQNAASISGNLQNFIMDQTKVNKRVDYENPTGTISDQTVDFNNYRETGIMKVVNCLIQNGPYKSENRHTLFLKITNLDGQTQYQTVYEGDNLYGRKLYNGSGQWHKYTNTPI